MNVLLIGSGAREHAIAWKLRQSPHTSMLCIAPGNGGTLKQGTNAPVAATDVQGLLATARERKVDLAVVGPESALEAGVVDAFQRASVPVFGPTKAAACIETSKAFAKELMLRYHVPTADGIAFDSYEEARRFLERHDGPIVVKADGLAGGKGVTIAMNRAEAFAGLDLCMQQRAFGEAGSRVVIEEFMEGREVSVFAFTDGSRISPLVAACDYKRAYDDDRGPNTGGMGSYSPPEFWDAGLAGEAEQRIFRPVIDGMAKEGRPYRGVLYGGLMLTRNGLKVVEFNARLGDPEAQVVLPRLQSDLVEIAQAVSQGDLSRAAVVWNDTACVGVVMASQGYPDSYTTGFPIRGLEAAKEGSLVFHAGTRADGEAVATSGGRVLTVVGQAPSLTEARSRAYAAVQSIRFQNAYFRKDIALRAIGRVS